MKKQAGIGALKLSLFLQPRITEDGFLEYSRFLDSTITIERLTTIIQKNKLDYANIENDNIPGQRLKQLLEFCNGNQTAITCLELAFLEYMDSSVNDIFHIISPNQKKGVTLEIAVHAAYPDKEILNCTDELWEAYQILTLILEYEEADDDFIHHHFHADTRLISYLNGEDHLSFTCQKYMECFLHGKELPRSILYEKEIEQISLDASTLLDTTDDNPIIHITGKASCGKKFTAKHIAKKMNVNLLFFDFSAFTDSNETLWINRLAREVYLSKAALCLYQISPPNERVHLIVKKIAQKLACFHRPLFVLSDETLKIVPFLDNMICEFEIKKLTPLQSFKIWNEFSTLYLADKKINSSELSVKMNIPIGYIEKIVKILSYSREETLDEGSISKICYRVLDDGRYTDIKPVSAEYTWDDLKLRSQEKNILLDIFHQVKYKLKVFEEFGLSRHYPYGKCVSALFSGPPGTGKTMAVHVLSNMLKLELYKVDLSKVIDKYIGETEKRLEEIFMKAEQSNMILFFDEADAIFGKRNEVTDSKDRYANTQVSYILQRIEEFDGIVILATNYRSNIDAAFMRRIRYEIKFTMPSAEIRREIWESLFLPEIPVHFIDFEYLAEQFEFSGALIKNVFLNAVFKAVSENKPLDMTHILQSIVNEYEKMGKMIVSEDFGSYSHLIWRS
ncbi:ATP-binding protein [Anaeromicropila populeti]|uniref:ATPase family associated with various cellular activities (AAA) n=1 Tax=Anaeromicropila populeti TaxID=37658 RepID=A0A1I6ISF7_9FIRM|nr:ATP-binding protein [Anaeromicropila populeti]SFR69569.1 ATPase family associated with various cellular activities (AAA) [Anaeromicropila populeti]